MGRVPTALALVTISVPQEEAFEVMAGAAPIIHRIGPGPAEIADRFVSRLGDVDRGEFTGAQELS